MDRICDAKIRAGCQWATEVLEPGTPPGEFVASFENGQWVYELSGVQLRNDMRPFVFVQNDVAAMCGDSGGRTKRGQPCKLKPADGSRCAKHPITAASRVKVVGDSWPNAIVVIEGHDWRPSLMASRWRHQPAQPVWDAELDRAARILGVSWL